MSDKAETAAFEVVVIGGGPAGSTAGAILADYGHRTLVVERERFPRFHIGESLMPETYWTLKRVGMLDKLRRSSFVKKYSVQFVNASGKESAPFYFDEMNPHECSQTWQVLRSEFDQMMLQNAAERGAEAWQPANVVEVLLEREKGSGSREGGAGKKGEAESASRNGLPRAVGVMVQRPDGSRVEVCARVVVDATGTSALLSRELGIRRPDPSLRKAAVFAHYRGGFRDPGKDEGATLVLHVHQQNGWFWSIALADDLVSIGVVGDIDYLIKGRPSPEQTLAQEIQKCPFLIPRLEGARRVGPVHVLSDFSYHSTACAGEGWVLIGDAFTFLDPIYSSGVFLALKSGELAADAIHDALEHDDVSAERLGRWGPGFHAGVQAIRKLVYAFYTKDFSFGQFNRAHPECKRNLVELLVGDVFRPEAGRIFDTMSRYCKLPEPLQLEQPQGRQAGLVP